MASSGDDKSKRPFSVEDPPSDAGYFHGSVNGQVRALRDALAALARIGHAIPADVEDAAMLTINVDGRVDSLDCKVTVADARAAIAALRAGQPVPRETLKEGGAKEVDPVRGLIHEKKGSGI